MENKILNINELSSGDIILLKTPMGDDTLASVIGIHPTIKYPIRDGNGNNPYRTKRDQDGKMIIITPESEGGSDDDKINEVSIMFHGGSCMVDETDTLSDFNIRLISEDHPKYDKVQSDNANKISDMINMFANAFGN
jgi:hypothetical protein